MNLSDPIGDMATRIRNAGMIGSPQVEIPSSKMKAAIADVLKETGYIEDYRVEGDLKKTLTIDLKYRGGRKRIPVIEGLKRVSRPSCRRYVGSQEIPRALGGLGVVILSTPKGIISDRTARKENIGGEMLLQVW